VRRAAGERDFPSKEKRFDRDTVQPSRASATNAKEDLGEGVPVETIDRATGADQMANAARASRSAGPDMPLNEAQRAR
jgi:hypothetical protein